MRCYLDTDPIVPTFNIGCDSGIVMSFELPGWFTPGGFERWLRFYLVTFDSAVREYDATLRKSPYLHSDVPEPVAWICAGRE